jgi:hypothetical protein
MNFGTDWKPLMGDMDKKTAFGILDYFYEQGVYLFFNYPQLSHSSRTGQLH